MRVSRAAISVTLIVLVALLATSSCEESDPAGPSTPNPAKATPLPDGLSDRFGPLPESVAGHPVTRGAAPGYVSDQACKKCHAAEYESYQSMGMARSFYRPDVEKAVETLGETFHHARTGYRYVMSARDGKYFLARYCEDDQDRRFAEFETEVAWIIGSGNHVRSYLSQNERGELFQLPISWYTGKGFAMSPGYDRVHHQRFGRMVDRGCMFCHNAYPEVAVGSDLPHRSHLFPRKLPHGIGCQRCHGPGARHVEAAENEDAADEDIRGRILNPANFTERQREDLCMSCHLQPESVRGRMMPRSFTNPMYSWKPGKNLTDFIKYLDHGTEAERSNRFEINHHAYRLRQSRCYVQSPGKLSCLTCHDPHRKIPRIKQAAYYRKKCMQCHNLHDCEMEEMGKTIDPAKSDCVSCHMAKARPWDVVHVTTTDHLIRRKKPATDLTAAREEEFPEHRPLDIGPYFPTRTGSDPLFDVYKGFGVSYSPTKETNTQWRLAFEKTRPHSVAAFVTVGRGLLENGDTTGAISILSQAVKSFPDDAPAHWTLGSALLRADHVPAAVAELERALALDGGDPGIQGTLADAYWRAGARSKARSAYERALSSRPNSWKTWQSYGYALQQMGKRDDALHALQKAIALNPRDSYSYAVSAAILENQGRVGASFQILQQGATLSIDVEMDLVSSLLLTDDPTFHDPKDALARATTLAKIHPDNGRSHLHLALALLIAGDGASAATSIESARRHGGDPACCTALYALVAARRKDRDETGRLLEKLRSDLRQPNEERLRPRLLHRLRSLGLLRP